MGFFNNFVLILIIGFAVFLLFRFVKDKPELLSSQNLNKSFGTMGVLALILIVVIGCVIGLLRYH